MVSEELEKMLQALYDLIPDEPQDPGTETSTWSRPCDPACDLDSDY